MGNSLIKLGVYIKFPSRINYIKYLSQFNTDFTINQQSLNKYIDEGKYSYIVEMPEFNLVENFYFDSTNAETCLIGLSESKRQINLLSILNCLTYNEEYSKSLYYKAFSTLLKLENTKDKIQQSKEGKFPKTSILLFLAEIGNTIGDTLSQGWFDLAPDIAKQINFFINTDIDIFNDATDNYGRRRTQYFILRLINKLLTYLKYEHVFICDETGKEFTTQKSLSEKFVASLKANGIRYRPAYNTRHTYATVCLMNGLNPVYVASQLGHSLVMLMKRYAKWINSDKNKEEIAKISNSAKIVPKEKGIKLCI